MLTRSILQQHASRVALVTGAGGAIGARIAERLALDDGAIVAIVDRDAATAANTVESIVSQGGRATAFIVDLADALALQTMLRDIDANLGAPDIVVNNAGIAATMPVLEYPLAHWQLTMAVNVTAPFLIAQHTLRAMQRKRWGRVVNIASISGVRAGTGRLGYGTSKAALIALTRQFAVETAEWGVTVNAIAPGPVDTPMIRGMHGGSTAATYASMLPMRRYGTTDEIAHAVSFLASDQAGYITGHSLAVDGGFLASGLLVRDLFEPSTSNAVSTSATEL